MRPRPKRSPSREPVISSTAKLSVKPFTVHSSWDSVAEQVAVESVDSAVVTTSMSSATISEPTRGESEHPAGGAPRRSALLI